MKRMMVPNRYQESAGKPRYLKPKIMDFNAFGILCPGKV